MVGADDNGREYVLGYSPDGRYEIVARPGKFFFRKKISFSFPFLVNIDRD